MILFGKRLKELRKQHNMTQAELGKLINVTKVSVCCYEKGIRIPSLETLVDIADIFNVKLDYLVGYDNFVIADDNSQYTSKMSKEEIFFIKELKKHNDLYNKIIEDPKRVIELINKKLK